MTESELRLVEGLRKKDMPSVIRYWDLVEEDFRKEKDGFLKAVNLLARCDLFYLLVRACRRVDMLNEFAFERTREVETAPDGYLDLWAREHYKSTIITFGKTIQDILTNPKITFTIFYHTQPTT